MAKITLHVTPLGAAELAAITAALAPFVSAGAPATAEPPTPAAAEEAPKPKRRAPRKAKPDGGPTPAPHTEPAPSTEQTSDGALGSREALLDAMRSALKAGKRAEVTQVLQEFGAARATELKDEDVAAATAMVAAL